MGALVIDNKKYARVLARVLPRVSKPKKSMNAYWPKSRSSWTRVRVVLRKRTPPWI